MENLRQLVEIDLAKYYKYSGITMNWNSNESLIENINIYLDSPQKFDSVRERIINQWDYGDKKYIETFENILMKIS